MNEEAGIDYGPTFNGDVGAILKNRLLIAITNHRDADQEFQAVADRLDTIGRRYEATQRAREATRKELETAAGAWETWERQQLQKAPQGLQEGPGRTEGAEQGD